VEWNPKDDIAGGTTEKSVTPRPEHSGKKKKGVGKRVVLGRDKELPRRRENPKRRKGKQRTFHYKILQRRGKGMQEASFVVVPYTRKKPSGTQQGIGERRGVLSRRQ